MAFFLSGQISPFDKFGFGDNVGGMKSSKSNIATTVIAAFAGSFIYNTVGFGATDSQSIIMVSCTVIVAFALIGFARSILD